MARSSWLTSLEFQQELWRHKTRNPTMERCLYVMTCLAVLIELRTLTDGQTDGQDQCRAVKTDS